ncbi:MAG TPA: YMGG-like glycine zipper-containing protein [Sphingomicrobium sp.]|nr:YMGG-like glycine zipper-containing protein [Sphingomicrobium sp.]
MATGALVGGALGAGAGAVIGGLSPIEGAVIGAAVGGLAGAIWADNDRDGQADGYVYNGQYYQGQPTGYSPSAAPPPPAAGERG